MIFTIYKFANYLVVFNFLFLVFNFFYRFKTCGFKIGIAHSIPIPNPLLMNPNPIPSQIYTIPTPNPIPDSESPQVWRLACLYLLECTAGEVHALRWVVVLQMSSIMFVIIYLKNTREKHSTETKSPRTAAFREKPKIRTFLKIFAVLSLFPCITIIGDTGKLMDNEVVAWPYIGC